MTADAKLQRVVNANVRGVISAVLGLVAMAVMIPEFFRHEEDWLAAMALVIVGGNIFILVRCLSKIVSQTPNIPNSTEDRLDELERLRRRDMVTPEEYAAKRQEILKDL